MAERPLFRVKIETAVSDLEGLQYMTLLGIMGAIRTASTAAIEIALDIPTVHFERRLQCQLIKYFPTSILNESFIYYFHPEKS